MSLFFFGNNFYKNKETWKIFSPQILEVYRILLVESTLESIMFHYTFLVINAMVVPCIALLYGRRETRTLRLSTTLLIISCGISCLLSISCEIWFLLSDCFHKFCFSGTLWENSEAGWDLGNRMARGYRLDVKWVFHRGSYAWVIQVFCWRNKVINRKNSS